MNYLQVAILSLLIFSSCDNNKSNNTEARPAENLVMEDQVITSNHQSMSLEQSMRSMTADFQKMNPSADPDYDFSSIMSRHHQGALDMCRSQIAYGKDSLLISMAKLIADDQQKEISELENFMRNHKPTGSSDFATKALKILDRHKEMNILSGNQDADYAAMMIQHHKDGIEMAKLYQPVSKEKIPAGIANYIVLNQTKDLTELEAWLSGKNR